MLVLENKFNFIFRYCCTFICCNREIQTIFRFFLKYWCKAMKVMLLSRGSYVWGGWICPGVGTHPIDTCMDTTWQVDKWAVCILLECFIFGVGITRFKSGKLQPKNFKLCATWALNFFYFCKIPCHRDTLLKDKSWQYLTYCFSLSLCHKVWQSLGIIAASKRIVLWKCHHLINLCISHIKHYSDWNSLKNNWC